MQQPVSIVVHLCCVLLSAVGLTLVPASPSAADDRVDPTSAESRERLHKQLDAEIGKLTAQIEKNPKNVGLYERRGDQFFFRAKFAEAVADYEKMVELDAKLEASHWRRGIAYFYAGQYKDAAHQFEIYHSFDNVDRENGIWRYLSQMKSSGKDTARAGLLKYEKDDREPFPDVYRLFAGDLTGDEVLSRIRKAKLEPTERDKRLFYAELYVGLNDFVEGRTDSAEAHLREAVKNPWGAKATGGPGYMWHVARVHDVLLREAKAKVDRPEGK